jgi:universal stress protein A
MSKSTIKPTSTRMKRRLPRSKEWHSTSRKPDKLKPTPSLKLRTILAPVDFSERSQAALKYALRLALEFGASLVVLHALDPLIAAGRVESARLRQLKSAARSEAEQRLEDLHQELRPSGVRARLVLRPGSATETIVAFALESKADLIVMGSQGRAGLNRLLIGSVAERVVRHASCPVLVVR